MNMPMMAFIYRWRAAELSAIFIILAFTFNRSELHLAKTFNDMKKAYKIDLNLSQHQSEHLQIYQDILQRAKLPEEKRISVNTLIQSVQETVAAHKLLLQELRPVTGDNGSHPGLFLEVECRMADLLNFL